MNSLILCEGSTDAILLSYYLNKVYGWEYCKKTPSHLDIKQRGFEESINWYKRGDDRLLICGVGGKDKMSSFFNSRILSPMIKSKDTFVRMALILDRDDKSIDSIEKHASTIFKPVITEMKNNAWIRNTYSDTFEMPKHIESLLIIIPPEHQGALENLMLDSISEDSYDAEIVKRAGVFVDEIQTSAYRYINNNRKKLKAHLGVTWAVQYPEKVFKLIDEQIRSVAWENSEILHNCFLQLGKI